MAFEFSLPCVCIKDVSMVLGTGQCGLDTAAVKPLAVPRASSPMTGSYPTKGGLQPDICLLQSRHPRSQQHFPTLIKEQQKLGLNTYTFKALRQTVLLFTAFCLSSLRMKLLLGLTFSPMGHSHQKDSITVARFLPLQLSLSQKCDRYCQSGMFDSYPQGLNDKLTKNFELESFCSV